MSLAMLLVFLLLRLKDAFIVQDRLVVLYSPYHLWSSNLHLGLEALASSHCNKCQNWKLLPWTYEVHGCNMEVKIIDVLSIF